MQNAYDLHHAERELRPALDRIAPAAARDPVADRSDKRAPRRQLG
jgi:hypothetical protein